MAENDVKRIHAAREVSQNFNQRDSLFVQNEEKVDAVLENESNFGRFDGLDSSGKKEKEEKVKEELDRRIRKITQDAKTAEKHNGILRRGFSWVKNLKWVDKISNSTNDVIAAQSDELKSLNGEDISKIFLETTGFEYTDENIEKFLNGEILTKSEEALKKYKEGQQNFSEFGSDMASTMLATTAFTAAGAFIATLGAPALLVGLGGVAAAAIVGAGIKVVTNALAANNANEKYDSMRKDLLLGAVNGVLAPLTAIGGGKIASKIVTSKLFGGTATKALAKGAQKVVTEGVEEVAEKTTQKASSIMTDILNPYGYDFSGSNLVKAIGYTTQFAIDGSIGGAADAAVRTSYEGGTSEEILKSAGQGALFGTVGALSFGWGFKGLGSLAHNWGYNKGIEVNGGRSVNDPALIDTGGDPAKRYHIPKPKDNSGTLYSGLPIMEIARFLGKNADFKTLDDVAEDYLIHKFYSMKRYAPELYREIMNGTDGATHALDDIELTPQKFVEDVLFSEETLSTFDFFEFKKFKRKFNKESLNENLEDLLRCYEMINPEIHSTTQAKNVVDDISSKPVIEDKPAAPKAEEAPVKPADTGADSTPTKPANTGNNETPTESGSGSPIQSALTEKELKEKALEGINAIKGVQSTTEYLLKDEIFKFYKANDMDMCHNLKEIFNLYCGIKKKGNKNVALAFETEYKAAQGDINKLKQVIQKYKNLTPEQIDRLAEEQTLRKTQKKSKTEQETNAQNTEGSSSTQAEKASDTDNSNLKANDSEGIKDKNVEENNGKVNESANTVANAAQRTKIITQTLDNITKDFKQVQFLDELDDKRLETLATQYLISRSINKEGQRIPLTQDPIINSPFETEILLMLFAKHENDGKRLSKNNNDLKNLIPSSKQAIKIVQNEYRANLILKTLKSIENPDITPIEILNVLKSKYKFSDADSKHILKIVETRLEIEKAGLSDYFPSKGSSRTRATAQNIELAEDLIKIKTEITDFEPSKYPINIVQIFCKLYKNKSADLNIADVIKLYEIINNLPNKNRDKRLFEQLFDEKGSIFEFLYPKNYADIISKLANNKRDMNDEIILIERLFKTIQKNNITGLREFYRDNNIERIFFVSDLKTNNAPVGERKNIEITFSGKIPADKKITLLKELFENSDGKITLKPEVETNITYKSFVDDILKRFEYDLIGKRVSTYKDLYEYLGISSIFKTEKYDILFNADLKTKEGAKLFKSFRSDIYNALECKRAEIDELCKCLNSAEFDIFTDSHTKVRFLTHIVLKGNSHQKNITQLIKTHINEIIKAFETQPVVIHEYVSPYVNKTSFAAEIDYTGKHLRICFDGNQKIRTIFWPEIQKINKIPLLDAN